MKKLLIMFLLGMLATTTQAQTFAEWFKQKKTQKKYLVQQIAALQVYIGCLLYTSPSPRDGLLSRMPSSA